MTGNEMRQIAANCASRIVTNRGGQECSGAIAPAPDIEQPPPAHQTPCALTPLLRCHLLQVGRCSLRKRVPIRGGIKDEVRAPRILSTHASTPALGLVISPPPTPSTSLKPVCSVFLPALSRVVVHAIAGLMRHFRRRASVLASSSG